MLDSPKRWRIQDALGRGEGKIEEGGEVLAHWLAVIEAREGMDEYTDQGMYSIGVRSHGKLLPEIEARVQAEPEQEEDSNWKKNMRRGGCMKAQMGALLEVDLSVCGLYAARCPTDGYMLMRRVPVIEVPGWWESMLTMTATPKFRVALLVVRIFKKAGPG